MEFPELGKHCSNSSCKQLDFLPMKCDACGKTFCKDHVQYSTHSCPEAYRKDNQVPVCPLCNTPCPVKKGETPDVVVGRHLDNDCQSDSAKQRRKIYTNKCSLKSCKQKELIPVTCDKCHKNFCLRHRNELDHECKGFQDTGRQVSKAGAAAISRHHHPASPSPSTSTAASTAARTQPQQTTLAGMGRLLDQERRNRQAGGSQSREDIMPGHMTEEEAIRLALQASVNAPSEPTPAGMTSQEEEDLLLARALAASEEEEERRRQQRNATAGGGGTRVSTAV